MVFGHRNFWLLFRILKFIYFPTVANEETYVAGGGGECSEIVFLVGFRKSAPGLNVIPVFIPQPLNWCEVTSCILLAWLYDCASISVLSIWLTVACMQTLLSLYC